MTKRERRYSERDASWSELRDSPVSARKKLETIMTRSCRDNGFCGGSGGYVPFIVDGMERIDASAFARVVLIAEGWPPDEVAYETRWLTHFEQIFREVFGDEEVELGPR